MLGFDRALLNAAERLLNRSIRESTAARDLIADLAGATLVVEVQGLGLRVGIVACPDRVELTAQPPEPVAVTVRGAPLELLRLLGPDPSAALRASRTEVAGQLELAQKFADLLRLVRPDPEHEAARLIGDVPAHELGRTLRAAERWFRGTAEAAERSLGEFLQEEGRALPVRCEVEDLLGASERLRDDVERFERRLALCEHSLAGSV